ncbi:MAG: hypothetical protein AAGE03_12760 [Pseudomonadota bacterium]
MTGTLTAPIHPSAVDLPDRGRRADRHKLIRTLRRWIGFAGLAIMGAAILFLASLDPLDPFAPDNSHATPAMLAAWEQMMEDG